MYTALPILGAAFCHEVGHLACARSLGLKIRRVGVSWRGPYIVRQQGSAVQNLAVSMAGPLVNLVLAGTMVMGPWLGLGVVMFGLCNLVVGLYNLLPVPCSDGRRILILLCTQQDLVQPYKETSPVHSSASEVAKCSAA